LGERDFKQIALLQFGIIYLIIYLIIMWLIYVSFFNYFDEIVRFVNFFFMIALGWNSFWLPVKRICWK